MHDDAHGWPHPDSRSAHVFERARQVLPGGISRLMTWIDPYPIYARRGEGARIEDEDGVWRLDFMNNFASLIHGHAHPQVVEAVREVVARGSCFALPTESEVALAEVICERVASVDKVRFCNSGTEAVMLAMKAARARTGRHTIAKVEGAYHGMYDYAEVSLDPTPSNWGNTPVPVPHTHGTPQAVLGDMLVLPHNDAQQARQLIESAGNSLAAVLIDPVPTAIGMIPGDPDYLQAVQDAARAVGALVIVDEVIAFRLGYHGGQARYGLDPDLSTFAKIIGGGYPVGAVGGRDDAMAVFSHEHGKPLNPSSGTLTGNPVTMTAGLATMSLLTREAYEHLEQIGERAREGIRAAIERSGRAGQVTGAGSMFQIHLHDRPLSDYRSIYPTPEESAMVKRLHGALLRSGFIVAPKGSGFLSTANTEEHVDALCAALGDALQTL
jgi:glutamate-1-semialdehyde 2,1-aminomutase